MKVLVTGASGFIGKSLCEELVRQSKLVVAAVRVNHVHYLGIESCLVGQIENTTDWSKTLINASVIVHLAARVHVMHDNALNPLEEFRKVNVHGTLQLAREAAKAGVKRFIFVSSIKVNGESSEIGKPFTAADLPSPQDAYGISKLEAEQGLKLIAQQTGMEVVIIRPPLVYGAEVKANFANMLRMTKRSIPLPFGAIHNKRSFVFIGNLVSLIVRCIEHPNAANQTFLVSDGCDLSTTQLLRACAAALGVETRIFSVPKKLIEVVAAILGKQDVAQRLCGNLQVDISKARALLDWAPPFTVEEGLRITANGFNKVNK